ncbi:hypothetical protein CAPTEDRAFT_204005 [Capitella teleta]|uniref:SUEL-type lectin domain-containing protein n=1 Tax=Capitella teleta TaxID=283909 RepID=R7UVL2_CAPTE|nr:hypothetical protein CAPTEDRAFT_204005 [Capitella teleta]|eukprot:ELU10349.1 hypothetical protein CAPTEDRAFT_204005 [Capitella teleta]
MEYSCARLWISIVSVLYLPQHGSSLINTNEIIEETCMLETFSPRCPSSQQIFITRSHFGHIQIGKCVKMDFGQFGCKSDVTDLMRRRCNGKTRCQVEVADEEIVRTQPCVEGLSSYLESAFVCIPEIISLEHCTNVLADRQWSYVMSTTIENSCLKQGQPIEVTTLSSMDIEVAAKIINGITSAINSVHVTVRDTQSNTTLIEIPKSPVHQTFQSSSIHILFEPSNTIVLFAFRALGCKDMVAPQFTWIERNRNTLTIGCVHNEYTWQVKCIGSKWIGFRGNCTRQTEIKPDVVNPPEVEQKPSPNQTIFTKGIQYALTIGITVLFCVVVITTGFVCLRKAEYKAKASKGIELQEMTGDYSNTWKATLMRPVTNDLNNPNASPPQQFYVLNQQTDTPIGTFRPRKNRAKTGTRSHEDVTLQRSTVRVTTVVASEK